MKHSFEIKLAAVNHYLAGHAGIISTAKLFQLSHTSLSHWINLFLLHGPRHWIADTSVAILLKINFAWFFMLSGILSLYPDITEFRAGGQKLYLSPSTYLFNGEIVCLFTLRGVGNAFLQALTEELVKLLGC